eukprot:a344586_4.p1 GENE.a344586_4~~a344586_4.p1  ORF type:complete len:436 (+),score=34.89 a344586_4:189-1310(+)
MTEPRPQTLGALQESVDKKKTLESLMNPWQKSRKRTARKYFAEKLQASQAVRELWAEAEAEEEKLARKRAFNSSPLGAASRKARAEGLRTSKLLVPLDVLAAVIGECRDLQARFCVSIKFDSVVGWCLIQGASRKAVDAAVSAVQRCVAAHVSPSVEGGSAHAATLQVAGTPAPSSTAGAWTPATAVATTSTTRSKRAAAVANVVARVPASATARGTSEAPLWALDVEVPRSRFGAVIGRGGSVINELRERHGVFIQLDDYSGLCLIEGKDRAAVEAAAADVCRIADRPTEREVCPAGASCTDYVCVRAHPVGWKCFHGDRCVSKQCNALHPDGWSRATAAQLRAYPEICALGLRCKRAKCRKIHPDERTLDQ